MKQRKKRIPYKAKLVTKARRRLTWLLYKGKDPKEALETTEREYGIVLAS